VLYSVLVFVLFFAISDSVWLERFRRVILAATLLSLAIVPWWMSLLPPQMARLYNGPGMYSTYLVTVYPFALIWLARGHAGRLERVVNGVVLMAILAASASTINRAVWVALAIETLVVLTLWRHSRELRQRRRQLILLTAVVTCVFVGSLYAISSKRFAISPTSPEVIGQATAQDARRNVWKHAIETISQQPFSGAGFGRGATRQDFRDKFGDGLLWHGHNTVLNYGLAMGVWGIALILLLFGIVLHRLRVVWGREDPVLTPYALGGIAMVVGVFAKNMTDDFFIRQNALLFWALAAMILGAHARRQQR
jgi:O-antigen ligase